MERIALITGAGRGIGAATAAELGRRGFHVVVNYRSDEASARAVAEGIEKAGGSARAVRADVCDPAAVAGLLADCGTIDVLVCNANIMPPFMPFSSMPWEAFSEKLQGELAAVFHVSQQVLREMSERKAGQIVYISSLSADLTRPGAVAHSAAKSALDAFARHVAAEAATCGITVNTVVPGAVRTEAASALRTPEMEADLGQRSVLGRMLDPEDVATVIGAVVDGAFHGVTGARIPVDGGFRVLTPP
ncbi:MULTISPECIES: SDR family oxidoreductase [Actinomadura]|uniref:SDR family oxidoreductase n=1 Tax=Actinomadura yumaensis TaxID=111807 RepID=A0ABW2CU10_9ACTN|nr:SDR family oxidoreductase [Actinomadura sp. J1-007]MWK35413.1 SDR family oxidoreductase [Actinomadura sp. J1-007]